MLWLIALFVALFDLVVEAVAAVYGCVRLWEILQRQEWRGRLYCAALAPTGCLLIAWAAADIIHGGIVSPTGTFWLAVRLTAGMAALAAGALALPSVQRMVFLLRTRGCGWEHGMDATAAAHRLSRLYSAEYSYRHMFRRGGRDHLLTCYDAVLECTDDSSRSGLDSPAVRFGDVWYPWPSADDRSLLDAVWGHLSDR